MPQSAAQPRADAPRLVNLMVNGRTESVPPGLTVAELLARLQLPQKGIAVEVNEQIIPRARHAEHPLTEGDRLEVVSLVGGG
jgi:sulfur carrier protein